MALATDCAVVYDDIERRTQCMKEELNVWFS
jgi:hypothetical protein